MRGGKSPSVPPRSEEDTFEKAKSFLVTATRQSELYQQELHHHFSLHTVLVSRKCTLVMGLSVMAYLLMMHLLKTHS